MINTDYFSDLFFKEGSITLKARLDFSSITIEVLREHKIISDNAYVLCKNNDLFDLKRIIDHYRSNIDDYFTFHKLKGSSVHTAYELLNLSECLYTSDFDTSEDNYYNSLNYLLQRENLSKYAMTACDANGLTDLVKIRDYYISHNHSFSKLKNCDKQTAEELTEIYRRFASKIARPFDLFNYDKRSAKPAKFLMDTHLIDIYDHFLNFDMMIRTKTIPLFKIADIIINYSCRLGPIEKEIFKGVYICPQRTLEDIARPIDLSRERIRQYKERLVIQIIHGRFFALPLQFLKNRCDKTDFYFSGDLITVTPEIIDNINKANETNFRDLFIGFILSFIYDNHILLDKSINQVSLRKSLFNLSVQKDILRNLYLVNKDYDISAVISYIKYLRSLGKVKRDEDEIVTFRSLLNKFVKPYQKQYSLTLTNITTLISERNDGYDLLKSEYNAKIIQVIEGSTSARIYSRTGQVVVQPRILLSAEVLTNIDFTDVSGNDWTTDAILNQTILSIQDEFKLKRKDIKSNSQLQVSCQRQILTDKFSGYVPMFKTLAENEFGIRSSKNCLLLKRNTLKRKYEYCIEILHRHGKPMKAIEIFEASKLIDPDIFKNDLSVSHACYQTNEIIHFGRTSTYGLKKWEREMDGIRGGTIRTIAEEFLEKCNKPMHIDQITEYVNNYRKTNSKNVFYNLRLVKTNTFFFPGDYSVGLVKWKKRR